MKKQFEAHMKTFLTKLVLQLSEKAVKSIWFMPDSKTKTTSLIFCLSDQYGCWVKIFIATSENTQSSFFSGIWNAFLTFYSLSIMNFYQKRLPMEQNIDILTYQHIDIIAT